MPKSSNFDEDLMAKAFAAAMSCFGGIAIVESEQGQRTEAGL